MPSLDNGLTFIETLSNPFQGGIQEPVGAALGAETFVGQSITFFDPNPRSPRMQRWQVGIQRELPGRWVWDIAYVGNRGSHIQTNRNLNTHAAAVPEHESGPRSGTDQLSERRTCRTRS